MTGLEDIQHCSESKAFVQEPSGQCFGKKKSLLRGLTCHVAAKSWSVSVGRGHGQKSLINLAETNLSKPQGNLCTCSTNHLSHNCLKISTKTVQLLERLSLWLDFVACGQETLQTVCLICKGHINLFISSLNK